jgi:hypothetical protein
MRAELLGGISGTLRLLRSYGIVACAKTRDRREAG